MLSDTKSTSIVLYAFCIIAFYSYILCIVRTEKKINEYVISTQIDLRGWSSYFVF